MKKVHLQEVYGIGECAMLYCNTTTEQSKVTCKNCLKAITRKAINRLTYLRHEIEAERISTSEIIELQSLIKYIDPSDTLLLQWAGVSEK